MDANDLPAAKRFWLNAQVRAATAAYKQERREDAQAQRTSAGVADPSDHRDMHNRQSDRADLRESMEQSGQTSPSLDGQLDMLDSQRQDGPGGS